MARTRTRLQNNDKNNRATAEPRQDDEVNDVVEVARKDRPTPSARKVKRGAGSTGLINRIPVVRSIVAYVRGVFTELQKVTWPTRDETTRLTGVVLAVTVAFAIGLGILDAFFSWWFRQAFHADSEGTFLLVAVGVAAAAAGTIWAMRRYV